MTQLLTIPGWHPARLNELMHCHFATRAKRKRIDRDMVAGYALLNGTTKAEGKRRVFLHLTLAPKQRAGDPDAYWKSLLDALVHAGLLTDDNRQGCEIESVTFARGEKRKTATILEDI